MIVIYESSTGKVLRTFGDMTPLCDLVVSTGEEIKYRCPTFTTYVLNDIPYDNNYAVEVLKQKKNSKIQLITSIRNSKELDGFEYMGKVFDSDEKSIRRISIAAAAAQAAQLAGQGFTITWTCKDNTTVELSAQDFLQMLGAMASYGNSIHEYARQLKERVEAATTQEELDTIVW